MKQTRPRAFTLVELLVVIGIIALLISILLPALNKARDQSRRVACLSGMRELSNSLRLYAAQYRDACPIGYMDTYDFSYFVNWRNANGTMPTMLGLLALSKSAPSGKAFYCPALDDPQYMYNTPENPWPDFRRWPDNSIPAFAPTANTVTHTRVAYNLRPIANWPSHTPLSIDYTSGTPQSATVRTVAMTTASTAFWMPELHNVVDGSAPTVAVVSMPRLSKLKNLAIISDLIIDTNYIKKTHKSGINVLYANGGGKYVTMSEITGKSDPNVKAWLTTDPATEFTSAINTHFLTADVAGTPILNVRGQVIGQTAAITGGGVWSQLDRAGR